MPRTSRGDGPRSSASAGLNTGNGLKSIASSLAKEKAVSPRRRRLVIMASAVAATMLIGIGVFEYYTPRGLSVPPPVTEILVSGCNIPNAISPMGEVLVVVNSSDGIDVTAAATVSPAIPLEAVGCSYAYSHTTTPVACGVMCGGGIGNIESYSQELRLNLSLSPEDKLGIYNLTIASDRMSALFSQGLIQVSVNSLQVASSSTTSSITFELPSPLEKIPYQLVVSSTETTVP
jgi:hypothetical protein